MQEKWDWDSVPGSRRSPGQGHGNPLQYSCKENLMDREARQDTVHKVAKSWAWLKRLSKDHVTKYSAANILMPTQHSIIYQWWLLHENHLKDSLKNTCSQPTKWEKIIANDMNDKGLTSKIYKQLIQFNIKKIKLKNGQKTWLGISPRMTYRWLAGTWKYAPYH